jgi:hypothetical protein
MRSVARRSRILCKKKEEFPGGMKVIPPGNSFPQICVVSVNHSVEISEFTQDYGDSVEISNAVPLLKSKQEL